MKQTHKIPALLLAMLMLVSVVLTGCQKEEIPAADAVAVAIYDIVLKDDASALVALFGYTSEEEAREDMGIQGSIYDDLADQMVDMFKSMQINATTEDAQTFVDAFLTMFKNVEFTAVTKESDEKAGTAVVTCTISTFDSNAMTDAMTQVVNDILSDPAALELEEDELDSLFINKMSEAIASLTPTDNTKDFDVDFVLEKHNINGKDRQVWMPKDVDSFGQAIGSNAIGG